MIKAATLRQPPASPEDSLETRRVFDYSKIMIAAAITVVQRPFLFPTAV
jgi:hypothetical protein